MECKSALWLSIARHKIELIDTLWNVNVSTASIFSCCLWINRYIMECKLGTTWYHWFIICELIDTLWNVNLTEIDGIPGQW